LKSDYRYSNKLVYNNFPWPNPTQDQRERVEEKARAVLAAREPHLPPRGLGTLADLYDPLSMPPALAKAHAELDRAVEKCYRPEPFDSDRQRVEYPCMEMSWGSPSRTMGTFPAKRKINELDLMISWPVRSKVGLAAAAHQHTRQQRSRGKMEPRSVRLD
jgi:hypothetical protein